MDNAYMTIYWFLTGSNEVVKRHGLKESLIDIDLGIWFLRIKNKRI